MVESTALDLAGAEGGVHPASVSVTMSHERRVTVTVRWEGRELDAVASDAFTALCEMRERLAGLGLVPRCYGACRNLVVSGMGYDMGAGLRGYLVRLGQPSRSEDLVSIFASGPDMDLASVAEQREFKRAWLQSFRK